MTIYTGGCHCGDIAFEFESPDITEAMECNCTLCVQRGWLLHAVPAVNFTLKTPRAKLGNYRFHKRMIEHHFCLACGAAPFSEAEHPKMGRMTAVNLRCVAGIDPKSLAVKFIDGRSF